MESKLSTGRFLVKVYNGELKSFSQCLETKDTKLIQRSAARQKLTHAEDAVAIAFKFRNALVSAHFSPRDCPKDDANAKAGNQSCECQNPVTHISQCEISGTHAAVMQVGCK